jgi:hypothetical protein
VKKDVQFRPAGGDIHFQGRDRVSRVHKEPGTNQLPDAGLTLSCVGWYNPRDADNRTWNPGDLDDKSI